MAIHKAARGLAPRLSRGLVLCLSISLAVLSFAACTIVKDGASGSAAGKAVSANADGSFDAKSFVDANWSGKIAPDLAGNAAEIKDVVSALAKDAVAAEKKYGRRGDETAPYNFVVKGRAAIRSVNTESAAGYVELDLSDVSGEGKVRLQAGPVLKGSSVRDSLSFIKFGDFVNQLDYANISREINFHIRDKLVADLRESGLAGKTLSFVGAFTEDPSGSVLVTPVEIRIEK
jgi:predicted lipoprotein